MIVRDPRLPRLTSLARAVLFVGLVLLFSGCRSRPRAPLLRDDPVYQNDREGFRFLAPEGWTQSSRSEVPPGKITKELSLVDYRRKTGKGASFLVTLADLDA